jgi:hypothetical protein
MATSFLTGLDPDAKKFIFVLKSGDLERKRSQFS